MESELVAGLCEMWLIFSLRSYKALFWVLGLIQYRNNNKINVIGILSDLYWKLIEHVNKIMNPYNGNLGYEKFYYNIIVWIYGKFYTWTSKILDPSERNTPCIDINLSFDNNNLLFEPGSSMFSNHLYNNYFPLFISNNMKKEDELKILYWVSSLKIWSNKSGTSYNTRGKLPTNKDRPSFNDSPPKNKGRPLNKGRTLLKIGIKKTEVNDKIKGKEKTISRSNKWKFIISEKSRKCIILGCKGKTYLDKVNTYFKKWSNYYIIRCCNSSKILLEYHYSSIKNENELTLKREDLPDKLLKFLNINKETKIKYDLKDLNCLYKDSLFDQLTHLFFFFRNGGIDIKNLNELKENSTPGDKFKVDYYNQCLNNINSESNITQYYFFCNNKIIYKGWISIIRIKHYSSAPNYYNNLIKRYHKDWYNLLKYYCLVPIYNTECNSNTNISNPSVDSKEFLKGKKAEVLEVNVPGEIPIGLTQIPKVLEGFNLKYKKGKPPEKKKSWRFKDLEKQGIVGLLYDKSQIPNKYRK